MEEMQPVRPDAEDYEAIEAKYGPLPAGAFDQEAAERYRLVQAAKLIRLARIARSKRGEVAPLRQAAEAEAGHAQWEAPLGSGEPRSRESMGATTVLQRCARNGAQRPEYPVLPAGPKEVAHARCVEPRENSLRKSNS